MPPKPIGGIYFIGGEDIAKQVGKSNKVKNFEISILTDGMNVAGNPLNLGEHEAQIIENMEFDAEGENLKSRRGLGKPIYTFDSDILYIWFDYELNSYIIFLKDGNTYKYEYGKDPVFIGTINGDGIHRPYITRFTNANGTVLLIASGGTMQSYSYDGTSIETSDDYPICETIMERFSRILVTDSSTNNIKYSGIADPYNWTINTNDASAMKDLDVGDASSVVGIYPLASELIIFKENGRIYKVANEPEDWNVTLVGMDSDFLSRDAITNLGEDIVYFSRQGLRSLETSETYGNFTNEEIGENLNPEMQKDTSAPWLFKSTRTHQLFINPNNGKNIYVYHYQLKSFTKWIFPSAIQTIAEGWENTLVGSGAELFSLSHSNSTDVVGGIESVIHQKIVSRRVIDLYTMTVYRSHLMVKSDTAGTAHLTVNDVSWDWNWTEDDQKEEFKTQIRSDDLTFTFETDDIITWEFWMIVLVYQYVTMVSGSSGSSSSGSSWSSGSWGQGTWGDVTNSDSGSPYG